MTAKKWYRQTTTWTGLLVILAGMVLATVAVCVDDNKAALAGQAAAIIAGGMAIMRGRKTIEDVKQLIFDTLHQIALAYLDEVRKANTPNIIVTPKLPENQPNGEPWPKSTGKGSNEP